MNKKKSTQWMGPKSNKKKEKGEKWAGIRVIPG